MLLQTNSYLVPRDRRVEHAKLLRRFRQSLLRLGCESFEIYEQVGANWNASQSTGRFVQIMRFRDRRHQQAVQQAEKSDPTAQKLIAEFCQLINFPYQQQQGLFATSYYTGLFALESARSGASAANLVEDETSTVASEPIAPVSPMSDLETAAHSVDADFADVAIPAKAAESQVDHAGIREEIAEAEKQRPVIPTIGRAHDGGRAPRAEAERSKPRVAPIRQFVESLEERSISVEPDEAASLNQADEGFDDLLNDLDEESGQHRPPPR